MSDMNALLDPARFADLTTRAARDPETFWSDEARRLEWIAPPSHARNGRGWFSDGLLNASANCLDRHLATRGDKVALIFQGEDEDTVLRLTYRDLHAQVCRMANVLRDHGVGKGDRVAIHLPSVPEGVIAMLACARIGAMHVVLFGGFSAEALADRLADSGARLVITADMGRRGAKQIPLKATMDRAIALRGESVETVLVVAVTGEDAPMTPGRDHALTPLLEVASAACTLEPMSADDNLFLLYTSGSTGKPKGMVHATGGYLLWAAYTHALAFDHREDDVFWCTADIGWITGHSYLTYGPLANGGTILIFEGMPSHPHPGRWWDVAQKHRVTTLYTSPTAIRALMREGDDVPARHDLSALRVLGTVGEPISAEAWTWFSTVIGKGRCPVVDTWWQTETGGIMIAPIPGSGTAKPGAAMRPLPGVQPILLDERAQPITGAGEGVLCITNAWPGQARTIWRDDALFCTTYLDPYPGYYFTGDGARRDEDGDLWITGRVDDVINVSGHRIGSAEIEDALAAEHVFAESAAIGIPHDLKGQGIVVYVVPRETAAADDAERAEALAKQAIAAVGKRVGRYAAPEQVFVVPDLPKTRSGKIVRRLLRKIACNETEGLGDLSTLADPELVPALIAKILG
ncbi:acetate--CoA ligase [Tanticharoenia sakaeratensis]|uniref:Acetate--CoA ligase n=1 Tax=Tanticharoenia sakaeratensis NBRC 103193 TaxID=1231623 RepID=A0A0D6MHR1_9PROT|nr:acetyl-coenzyme A synthetase [Tanticharoenia sakaeratensis NBRC 103193]GBQ18020.1 acetyl-CoA synthetase [Tanticharoenia sakaeratensis NBRC 103193]